MPRFQEVLNDEPLYKSLENFKFSRKINKDEMGGSAVSKTFWEEKKTGEIWFAKYHLNYAKIKENEEDQPLIELLANRIYDYYGIKVAPSVIVKLPSKYINSEENIPHELDKLIPRDAAYFFSLFLGGFQDGGEEYKSLLKKEPNLSQPIVNSDYITDYTTLIIKEEKLQEQGLGRILAIAILINDGDVIGPTGGNTGYLIRRNGAKKRLCIDSVRVDPGCAFWGFINPNNNEKISRESIKLVISGTGEEPKFKNFNFDELPIQTKKEFLDAVMDLAETPDEDFDNFFKYFDDKKTIKDFIGVTLIKSDGKKKEETVSIVEWLKQRRDQLVNIFTAELKNRKVDHKNIQQIENIPLLLQQTYKYSKILAEHYLENTEDSHFDYIPLRTAKHPYNTKDTQDTITLTNLLQTFLQDSSEQKILALLGEGGTGKSIASQECRKELWKTLFQTASTNPSFLDTCWIPIHIELEKFKNKEIKYENKLKNCIQSTLERDYKLTTTQVNELKKMRCLIILDGFDEIEGRIKLNLWEINNLSEWHNVKMLVTSRTSYLEKEDLSQYFEVPGVISSNIVRYLMPLSHEQIIKFLQNKGIHIEFTDQSIKQQSTLNNLLGIPLLLRIFQEAWPTLSSKIHNDLTRLELYTAFIEQWFNNNKNRLVTMLGKIIPPKHILANFEKYSEELAFTMYTQPKIICNPKKDDVWLHFLNNNYDLEDCLNRLGCPLRYNGEEYSFIHRSFQEFFAAKYVIRNLQQAHDCQEYKKSINFIKSHKYVGSHELLFKFISGLLTVLNIQGSHSELFEVFWTNIHNNSVDIVGMKHICLLLKCLQEADCDAVFTKFPDIEDYIAEYLPKILFFSKSQEADYLNFRDLFLFILKNRSNTPIVSRSKILKPFITTLASIDTLSEDTIASFLIGNGQSRNQKQIFDFLKNTVLTATRADDCMFKYAAASIKNISANQQWLLSMATTGDYIEKQRALHVIFIQKLSNDSIIKLLIEIALNGLNTQLKQNNKQTKVLCNLAIAALANINDYRDEVLDALRKISEETPCHENKKMAESALMELYNSKKHDQEAEYYGEADYDEGPDYDEYDGFSASQRWLFNYEFLSHRWLLSMDGNDDEVNYSIEGNTTHDDKQQITIQMNGQMQTVSINIYNDFLTRALNEMDLSVQLISALEEHRLKYLLENKLYLLNTPLSNLIKAYASNFPHNELIGHLIIKRIFFYGNALVVLPKMIVIYEYSKTSILKVKDGHESAYMEFSQKFLRLFSDIAEKINFPFVNRFMANVGEDTVFPPNAVEDELFIAFTNAHQEDKLITDYLKKQLLISFHKHSEGKIIVNMNPTGANNETHSDEQLSCNPIYNFRLQ